MRTCCRAAARCDAMAACAGREIRRARRCTRRTRRRARAPSCGSGSGARATSEHATGRLRRVEQAVFCPLRGLTFSVPLPGVGGSDLDLDDGFGDFLFLESAAVPDERGRIWFLRWSVLYYVGVRRLLGAKASLFDSARLAFLLLPLGGQLF